MNSRAAAWFAALIFFILGAWCSWDGWQKKGWKSKHLALRVGGVAALVAGSYSVAAARRNA